MSRDSLPVILLITSDLFFGMRIKNAAEQSGVDCHWIEGEKEIEGKGGFLALLGATKPVKVLLDLGGQLPWQEWLSQAKGDERYRNVPWLAFGSHVAKDILARAESLGADEVMARSKFTRELPEIIAFVK